MAYRKMLITVLARALPSDAGADFRCRRAYLSQEEAAEALSHMLIRP